MEEKLFLLVGADQKATSNFQLIAGTDCAPSGAVAKGGFRGDLMARISLRTFALPGLTQCMEDIAPNLDHELENVGRRFRRCMGMAKDV